MANTVTETQIDMFGEREDAQNLYLERAQVLDAALSYIKDNIKTFKTLTTRAGVVEGKGNVLNKDANAQQVENDTVLRDYLTTQANMKGPISDALGIAAKEARGTKRLAPGVVQAFLARVTDVVGGSGEVGGRVRPAGTAAGAGGSVGVTPSPPVKADEVPAPIKATPAKPAPARPAKNLFDQPGAKGGVGERLAFTSGPMPCFARRDAGNGRHGGGSNSGGADDREAFSRAKHGRSRIEGTSQNSGNEPSGACQASWICPRGGRVLGRQSRCSDAPRRTPAFLRGAGFAVFCRQ